MAIEGCISHAPGSKMVVRREDYLGITGDHKCAAELLALFEFWTNGKLSVIHEVQPEKRDEYLWLYESNDQLISALLGGHSENTIRNALAVLSERGFISQRRNPMRGWDKTKQYKLNISAVQEAINLWARERAIAQKEAETRMVIDPVILRDRSIKSAESMDQICGIEAAILREQYLSNLDLSNQLSNPERECHASQSEPMAIALAEVETEASQNPNPVKNQLTAEPTAEKSSAARPARKTRKKRGRAISVPSYSPDLFEAWWETYRKFCLRVDCSAGDRQDAVAHWDELLESGALPAEIQEGTDWYAKCKERQFRDKGEAIGVCHGLRYLRDRKWQEALDHKRIKNQGSPEAEQAAIASLDWSTDPRTEAWLVELDNSGVAVFCENGKMSSDRKRFAMWAIETNRFVTDVDWGGFLNG
ncbi:MAG TPA: hypothetical protein V6C63_07685 [Allocoleopsis sp.]